LDSTDNSSTEIYANPRRNWIGFFHRSQRTAVEEESITMLGRSALVRTVARANARRSMSDTPKMHKFKDCAGELKATRPPKDPHEHVSSSQFVQYGN
jgi:hypothetical protein